MAGMLDLSDIVKEGYLQKKSRFLKSWRRRWTVLFGRNLLCTFKTPEKAQSVENATEVIHLDKYNCRVLEKGDEKNDGLEFDLVYKTNSNLSFCFRAASKDECETWKRNIIVRK